MRVRVVSVKGLCCAFVSPESDPYVNSMTLIVNCLLAIACSYFMVMITTQ